MEALYLLAFCFGICALFFAGWCVAVAGTAIHAMYRGQCVRTAIRPLLEEL
jgi:hypothetical protein